MRKILFCCVLMLLTFCFSRAEGIKAVNPVLPGDRPDPTILDIDGIYWASATSNEWAPLFPIFRSDDMVNWELVSYVFPEGAPDWALKNFWAPELSYDPETKKVYLYYTARRKDNNRLAVAVASADRPDGTYTDHGPLVSQEPGSIDAFEITGDDGKVYVAWKEDGNSMGRPTPIWAQEIDKGRTKLIGMPVELFRNDESDDTSWERWLIEGVCIFKEKDYYYATFSGGGCCDKQCNYKTGVARARHIFGPWEKYPKNPILTDNASWKCAGHGTVVKKDGDWYMLYHAYHTAGDVYVGRQDVLEKLEWTPDGWPYFANNARYDRTSETLDFTDRFNGEKLNVLWQWGVRQKIKYATGKGGLKLYASRENEHVGTLLVQQTKSTDYSVTADIDVRKSGKDVQAGVCIVGGSDNGFGAPLAAAGITVSAGQGIEIWKTAFGRKEVVFRKKTDAPSVSLRMNVSDGHILTFSCILPGGESEMLLTGYDVSGLVPWGMGFRYGIVAEGPESGYAVFREVRLKNR